MICVCLMKSLEIESARANWHRCQRVLYGVTIRGGRWYRKKLSTADKSAFFKLSVNYRYRKSEFFNYQQNYRYRKMHQIWADNYTQETVIKKDHSLPFDNANLFWFRANILEQGQWYFILLTQLCRKFDFLNLLCGVDPLFWLFGRKYRKKLSKADISAFF